MQYQNIFTAPKDISQIKKACEISVKILKKLKDSVQIGNSPFEVNKLAESLCKENGVKSSFKGVAGLKSVFPSALCVMVNEETVHNIPNSKKEFVENDIIKVDFGINYNGFLTDHGVTVVLGEDKVKNTLASTVKLAVETSIKFAVAGGYTGDVSHVLGEVVALAGFTPVRHYCGHGIGKYIHLSPSIPFYGVKGTGERFEEGMLICIEDWITTGASELILQNDGWTLTTPDKSVSAMSEHMVFITKNGPEVLTEID